jgi:hypothetical protein
VEHAARRELLLQLRVLEVVGVLGLVLGVEVVRMLGFFACARAGTAAQ